MREKPNVLFVMTDRQRWDTIATLGKCGRSGQPAARR